jgi:hypothetical protein
MTHGGGDVGTIDSGHADREVLLDATVSLSVGKADLLGLGPVDTKNGRAIRVLKLTWRAGANLLRERGVATPSKQQNVADIN